MKIKCDKCGSETNTICQSYEEAQEQFDNHKCQKEIGGNEK